MGKTKHTPFRLLVAALVLLAACVAPAASQAPGGVTVFEGARLITGDGSAPIENSAFIVVNGEFTAVGRQSELAIPPGATRVDLAGKTVMPALMDDHVHMGYRKGTSFSADNYTRENLLDILDRFAFFGIAAILETGTGRGDLPYRVRAEARSGARYLTFGSGFGMPNAGPGGAKSLVVHFTRGRVEDMRIPRQVYVDLHQTFPYALRPDPAATHRGT